MLLWSWTHFLEWARDRWCGVEFNDQFLRGSCSHLSQFDLNSISVTNSMIFYQYSHIKLANQCLCTPFAFDGSRYAAILRGCCSDLEHIFSSGLETNDVESNSIFNAGTFCVDLGHIFLRFELIRWRRMWNHFNMICIGGKSSSDSVILNTSFSSFIFEEGSGDRSCSFNNSSFTDGRWWSNKTKPRLRLRYKANHWLSHPRAEQ